MNLIRYTLLLGISFSLACQATKQLSAEAIEQQATTAKKNGEWLQAAQLFETLYQRSPTDETANYEAGTNYLKANHLQKGLQVLKSFDPQYDNKEMEWNGRLARLAKAYYKTEQFAEVQKIVEQYVYPKMYRGLAREHLKSLIQLNKSEVLAKYFLQYQQSGIYDDKGKSTNLGFLYRAICNELLLVGEQELLNKYAAAYSEWANQRLPKDQLNWAIASFYAQTYDTAILYLQAAIEQEKSPRHQLELIGLLGICYAKTNKVTQVKTQLDKINSFPALPPRHDTFGAKWYHQARIQVALGQYDQATQLLQQAIQQKSEFWSNRFKEDGLLKDVFGQADFELLVKENQ